MRANDPILGEADQCAVNILARVGRGGRARYRKVGTVGAVKAETLVGVNKHRQTVFVIDYVIQLSAERVQVEEWAACTDAGVVPEQERQNGVRKRRHA